MNFPRGCFQRCLRVQRVRFAGAVFAASLAAAPLHAAEIRTAAQEATTPKFTPLYPDRKTPIGGLCVDIMRAIERIDPDLAFVGDQTWQPLVRVEAGVAHGQLDAACGFLRTREREAKFTYIDPPLYSMNYFLAVRADDTVQVGNWDDVRQLGDQGTVLVAHGFGIIRQLEKMGGLKIDSGGRDAESNLAKLVAGRGRFFIHRSPGIQHEITRAGMQGKVRVLPAAMHTENFYMVVSKKLPVATCEKIRNAIIRLNANGEIARLLSQWDSMPENTR